MPSPSTPFAEPSHGAAVAAAASSSDDVTPTTSATTVAAVTTEFLLQAPRLTNHNFDIPLNDNEIHAVDDFETLWYQFLLRNPTVLPPSTKLQRTLLEIPTKISQTQITKKQVEMELQRQLTFFETSKEQLESNFKSAMGSTAVLQQDIQDKLNADIDNVANADQLLSGELPWEFYFDNLDELVEQAKLGQIQRDIHDGKGPYHAAFARTTSADNNANDDSSSLPSLPSRRALYLAEIEDQTELAKAALMEHSSKILKKAYVIDHALLESEVHMKQRQIQRLEQTIASQKTLSKFLTEHNIWSLLPKDTSAGTTVGGGDATTRRSTTTRPTMNNGTVASTKTPRRVA